MARRRWAQAAAAAAAAWLTPGAFAEELQRTPFQTEGPFYPDKLPLDTDTALIVLNDSLSPAVGAITHLTGKVLSAKGEPVKNALVEIWQVDNNGAYLHSGTDNADARDRHFQGFGRFLTSSTGEYYFRTIRPVPYPGRTPHIHVKVKQGGKDLLTTQCYIKGHAGNAKDGIFRSLAPAEQALLAIEFARVKGSRANELAATFNMVLGNTPNEGEPRRPRRPPPKRQPV